jgi:hypothetical protein
LNGLAGLDDWPQEFGNQPTVRWMGKVPRERLFVVEVNNDCEGHVALSKTKVWTKRKTTDLRDGLRVSGEELRQCVYCRLVCSFIPRQEVHMAQHRHRIGECPSANTLSELLLRSSALGSPLIIKQHHAERVRTDREEASPVGIARRSHKATASACAGPRWLSLAEQHGPGFGLQVGLRARRALR